jgi:hypothetical protein
MEVGVRHFQADDGKPAPVAVKGSFDGMGNRFGKQQQAGQVFIGNVEEPVYLQLGYHKRVAFPKGKNIQERKKMVIFRNLIRRYFSGNDL